MNQPIRPLFSADPPPEETPPEATPLAATLSTTTRFLMLGVAVLTVAWLCSGIRPVDPGTQAVVMTCGKPDRVVTTGLALAWPRPLEDVVMVPGGERQLSQSIDRLDVIPRPAGTVTAGTGLDPRSDGGYVLTGDAGVVHLKGTVTYAVNDARSFAVSRERVPPAITRSFLAATIAACAGRNLDGVMVASPDLQGQALDESLVQSRERLRGDIVAGMNRRLATLGLGIAVSRIDIVATLPERARPSFDGVIAAEASAAKEIAEAKTAAERLRQEASAARAGILAAAKAKAEEIESQARVATNGVRELLAVGDPEQRRLLLAQRYGERMTTILKQAGSVAAVPADGPARIFVQGR